MRRRISEAFTADVPPGKEYRYKQSIVINEWLSTEVSFPFPSPDHDPGAPKDKRIAGTVYPAMGMRGDADNAVLLPEFVDSSLRIKTVRYVYVEAADQTASAYTFLTVGTADTFTGDQIQWQKNLPPEIHRRSHIALEDGHWAVRDGFGRIYDFH